MSYAKKQKTFLKKEKFYGGVLTDRQGAMRTVCRCALIYDTMRRVRYLAHVWRVVTEAELFAQRAATFAGEADSTSAVDTSFEIVFHAVRAAVFRTAASAIDADFSAILNAVRARARRRTNRTTAIDTGFGSILNAIRATSQISMYFYIY